MEAHKENIEGGLCTGTIENTLETAINVAKDILKNN